MRLLKKQETVNFYVIIRLQFVHCHDGQVHHVKEDASKTWIIQYV